MIDNLEALIALSKLGTMTEASTALRVSQSAISKRIAALEHQYGRKLIEKKGRKVSLTAHGVRLVEKTAPPLSELRNAIELGEAEAQSLFAVGVSESVLSSWGAREIKKVNETLGIETRLHTHRSPVVLDKVNAGEYQFGVCAGKITSPTAALISYPLGLEEMVIIQAGKLKRSPRSWDVISIESESATWKSIRDDAKNLNINVSVQLESFFSVAQMAKAGFGHALVPLGVAQALGFKAQQLHRFRGKLTRPLQFITKKSLLEIPAITQYYECLSKQLRTKLKR